MHILHAAKAIRAHCRLFQHGGQGFFYNRYAPPKGSGKLGTETDANVDQQLWYHVVGTPQAVDKWVYAVPEHPDWFIGAEITHDGRRALRLHPPPRPTLLIGCLYVHQNRGLLVLIV